MKIGRNDPCPCGSGRKYKKCCLEKEEIEALGRQASREEEVHAQGAADLFSDLPANERDYREKEDSYSAEIAAGQDAFFEEFDSADFDAKAGLLEGIMDSDITTNDFAYDLFKMLNSDAENPFQRFRHYELVRRLKDVSPIVYEKEAPYLLSDCIENALGDAEHERAVMLLEEFADIADQDIDLFDRNIDEAAYLADITSITKLLRAGWKRVEGSDMVTPFGIEKYAERAFDYEMVSYIMSADTPKADSSSMKELKDFYRITFDETLMQQYLDCLSGKCGHAWTRDDFTLHGKDGLNAEDAGKNVTLLICEFARHLLLKTEIPSGRCELMRTEITVYFSHLLEKFKEAPERRPRKGSRKKSGQKTGDMHILIPTESFLDRYLPKYISIFGMRFWQGLSFMEAVPLWLRFLEDKGLMDDELRRTTLGSLSSLVLPLEKMISVLHRADRENLRHDLRTAWEGAPLSPG